MAAGARAIARILISGSDHVSSTVSTKESKLYKRYDYDYYVHILIISLISLGVVRTIWLFASEKRALFTYRLAKK